jgi:hypothetical protein
MHDTLKKPRELLAVSYTIRFPELAAKSKNASGEIDMEHMDPAVSPFISELVTEYFFYSRQWSMIDNDYWLWNGLFWRRYVLISPQECHFHMSLSSDGHWVVGL